MGLLILGSGSAFAEDSTGSLHGVVNFCSKGGVEGMQIYIPGRQFMVITGSDGHFTFDRLPVGSYAIGAMLDGKVLYSHDAVDVTAGETTDLGQMDFCSEKSETQSPASTPALDALHKDTQNPEACAKNWADCDKNPANGCETNVRNDEWNCGACGNRCTTWQNCALGACQ